MKNMFKNLDEICEEAKQEWQKEPLSNDKDLFRAWETGWLRGAYMQLYSGMQRVLKALDEKNNEILELREKLEKYENL